MSNNIESMKDVFQKAMSPHIGDLFNRTLYVLCKNHPYHSEPGVILAKIQLIGRAYAAAIERRRTHTKCNNDDFYEKVVVPHFQESGIDKKISSLAPYDALSEANLPKVLSVHKYLVDLMKDITGLAKRSLALKYLHFHRPELFFIYDSRAASALRRCGKEMGVRLKNTNRWTDADIQYGNFSMNALLLKSELEDRFKHEGMTLRHFDNFLIGTANQSLYGKRKAATK